MLHHTFSHIHGIGQATERKLWEQGIHDWAALAACPQAIARTSHREIVEVLDGSRQALADNPHFFLDRLSGAESWRLFPHFRERTAYLDIETSGLSDYSEITTIALYDGNEVRTYVNGRNLEEFAVDIEAYRVIVTYNGICFDIPFIERHFRMKLDQAQLDLRYILSRLGCRGGLKGCEKQLGINRGALDGVDGSFAVQLWREYERSGSTAAIETLVAYNVEDTVNLERLMVEAYNRHVLQTPFADEMLQPYPEPPALHHQPDLEIIARLRRLLY